MLLKISHAVAVYLVFQDLSSKYIIDVKEAESAVDILRRKQSSYTLKNGDDICYHEKSWVIKRK